jgi:uncharacterized protein (UPF0333 family)
MRTKRGQTSIEFIIITGLAILVLGIAFFIYFDTASMADALGNQAAAEAACHHVAVTVSSVASGGEGMQAVLHLPPTIGNRDYTISVNGTARRVSVNYSHGFQACTIPTGNVTTNTNINKSGTVRNIGGVVLD